MEILCLQTYRVCCIGHTDEEPDIVTGQGEKKRRKKIIHQNPVTVTIFMRQHVYTTAEKHSSIFKLLLISFTHSLELMNARDP